MIFEWYISMNTIANKLVKSIKEMPDKFSLDDLLDRIVFLQKVEIGLEQSKLHINFKSKEKLNGFLFNRQIRL